MKKYIVLGILFLLMVTNVYAQEISTYNFSEFTKGTLNKQNGFAVSNLNSGSCADIVEKDGEKVLKLYRTASASGDIKVEKKLTSLQTTDVVIKMSVYLATSNEKALFYFISDSGEVVCNLRVNDDGTLQYVNSNNKNVDFSPKAYYKPDAWNDIEVHLIKENNSQMFNRVRVCLNSVVCYTSEAGVRSTKGSDFNRIRIQLPANGSRNTEMYFRYISLYERTKPVISAFGIEQVDGVSNTAMALYNFQSDYNSADCSSFVWQIADTKDGEYKTIENQSQKKIVLMEEQDCKYIRCIIYPEDGGGMKSQEIISEPLYVSFIKNQIFDFNDGSMCGFSEEKKTDEDSVCIENGKLKMLRTAQEALTSQKQLSVINGKCEFEFSLYIPDGNNPRFNLYTYGISTYDIPMHIQFYNGSILWHNGEKLVEIGNYETNREYIIKAVIDFYDDKVDLFIGGTILKTGLPMRSASEEIKSLKMQLQNQGTAYVDYVKVRRLIEKQHPQALLNENKISNLKTLIKKDEKYADMWKYHCSIADKIGNPASSYPEGTDIRNHGEHLMNLSFSYLITGEDAYYQKALLWAKSIALLGDSNYQGELSGAHHLMGLALFYDWCYDRLVSDGIDEEILNSIIDGGNVMNEWLKTDEDGLLYLSNQLHIRLSALAVSAIIISHEYDSNDWLKTANSKWNTVFSLLTEDGASIEGAGYNEYSLQYMLMYLDAAKQRMGIDYTNHPWIKASAQYNAFITIPYNSWGKVYRTENNLSTYHTKIDINDSPRYSWYGPDYLLRWLATNTNSTIAQTLADRYEATNYRKGITPFCNLLWYDANVTPEELDTLPTTKWFKNTGLVISRTDWSGDENVLTFSCGPAQGHKGTQETDYNLGMGHSHPSANSFSLFANGEMLIPNAGYVQRRTIYQNTLLVDGKGQLDQLPNTMWWVSDAQNESEIKLEPEILSVESNSSFDYIVGDATDNYPSLNKFRRTLIFLKPDVLLVCDDIEAKSEQDLELLFHMEDDGENVSVTSDGYLYRGTDASMKISSFTSADTSSEVQDILARNSTEVSSRRFLVRYKNKATQWKHITAIVFGNSNEELPSVTMSGTLDNPVFNVNGKDFYFNWDEMPDTYVKSDGSYSFVNNGEKGLFYIMQAKYDNGHLKNIDLNSVNLENKEKYEGQFKEFSEKDTVIYIWSENMMPIYMKKFN